MPVPMMNIINGGAHANNSLDIQEFMILPVGAPSFREALRYGAEIFHTLKKILHDRGLSTAVGDEGGFAPDLRVQRGGARDHPARRSRRPATRPARTSTWASTCASSEFFKDGRYELESREARASRAAEFTATWPTWPRKYPIITIEDGMGEGDWDGWAHAHRARSASKIQLVGDDLFVTNTKILKEGIEQAHRQRHPHQAQPDRHAHRDARGHRHGRQGALRLGRLASLRRDRGQPPSPTSRWRRAATQIKTGSLSRSDRMAKYNQLLRIEAELGKVRYAGREAFPVKI